LRAASDGELDVVLAKSQLSDAAALLVEADRFFNSRRERIVELVAGLVLPAIYEWREFVVAGGLMSYGPSLSTATARSGVTSARILKGEKAADLPIIQRIKFELVINLKTAKALGLAVPPILLAQCQNGSSQSALSCL
jgi:putative ABC transport system substrate-binding protein